MQRELWILSESRCWKISIHTQEECALADLHAQTSCGQDLSSISFSCAKYTLFCSRADVFLHWFNRTMTAICNTTILTQNVISADQAIKLAASANQRVKGCCVIRNGLEHFRQ